MSGALPYHLAHGPSIKTDKYVREQSSVDLTEESDSLQGQEIEISEGEDEVYRTIQLAPAPQGYPRDRILETPFAGDYRSVFINVVPPALSNKELYCLSNVNCSYLSTPGRPPTLLELKRHAHSLVNLIKHVTLSTKGGWIDGSNYTGGRNAADLDVDKVAEFHQNESFDFLNNLEEPYHNDDRHHHMPLTGLINTLELNVPPRTQYPDQWGKYRNICPLHQIAGEPQPYQNNQPYATHEALISHANEVLEYLDHEYSAKGGLLGILPQKENKEDRERAGATLLGQLILYTQGLVQRLHDLERCYANLLDVLAGEAVAPHQYLSRLGPQGRKPRDMVYPQDRFVLVNAGDDVYSWLQTEFNAREVTDEKKEKKWHELGLTSEATKSQAGGKEFAAGITAIDINTRYYRLRNDQLKTIFVIPAYQNHPNTKQTRNMEPQPTVVSVIKPLWPERVSTWERRHLEELAAGKEALREVYTLRQQRDLDERTIQHLRTDNQVLRGRLTAFQNICAEQDESDGFKPDEGRAKVLGEQAKASKLIDDNNALRKQLELEIQKIAAQDAEIWLKSSQLQEFKSQTDRTITAKHKELEEKAKRIEREDADVTRAKAGLEARLRKVWLKQIQETQVLLDSLKPKERIGHYAGSLFEEAAIAADRQAQELVDRATDPTVRVEDL